MNIQKIILLLAFFVSLSFKSQPNFIWRNNFGNAPYDNDIGRKITTDADGNIYTVGNFRDTADFDPGPSQNLHISKGHVDIYVAKFSASGSLIWAKSVGSQGRDLSASISIDPLQNVLVSGIFSDSMDADPGPLTHLLYASEETSIFILKLNKAGQFIMAKNIDASYGVHGRPDNAGNIYMAGTFKGTIDFDPGAATHTLQSQSQFGDLFILKLNPNGSFLWAYSIISNLAHCSGIEADNNGDINLAGVFYGTVDFDPGVGIKNLVASGTGVFALKLDANGGFKWATSFNCASGAYCRHMTADDAGNIYMTGDFNDIVDLDPGPTQQLEGSNQYHSIYITKIKTNGNFGWAKAFVGGYTNGVGVSIDQQGNVHSVGWAPIATDMDPGPGTYTLSALSIHSWHINILDSTGNFVCAGKVEDPQSSFQWSVRAITTDLYGNFYTIAANYDDSIVGKRNQCIFKYRTCGSTVGLVSNEDNFKIQFGPNPVTGPYTIMTPTPGTANLYDTNGKLACTYSLNEGKTELSMEGIRNGIYTMVFTAQDNRSSVVRLIVMKE